jgi:hypothetical protein
MPCLPIPTVTPPTLPVPFTLPEIVVPPLGPGELTICCKLPPLRTPPIPIPIPGLGLLLSAPGVVDALRAAVDVFVTYASQLNFECPVE